MDRTHVQNFHYLETEVPERYLKCDTVGLLQGLKNIEWMIITFKIKQPVTEEIQSIYIGYLGSNLT